MVGKLVSQINRTGQAASETALFYQQWTSEAKHSKKALRWAYKQVQRIIEQVQDL